MHRRLVISLVIFGSLLMPMLITIGQPTAAGGVPALNRRFVRALGAGGEDAANAIAAAPDGSLYVTGSVAHGTVPDSGGTTADIDLVLAKYSPTGALLWLRTLGGSGADEGWAVAVALDGAIYVAGYTESPVIATRRNAGVRDALLVKYNASGVRQWVRLLGGKQTDTALGVATSPNSNVYITGRTSSPTLPGSEANSGEQDIFLARYLPSGKRLYTHLLGGDGVDMGTGVAVAQSSAVFVVGFSQSTALNGDPVAGDADAVLAKYTADGTLQFTRLLGGTGDDRGRALTLAPDGWVYLAGSSSSPKVAKSSNKGMTDMMVARFHASGNLRWARLFGSTDDDAANAIAVFGSSSLYVAGNTQGRFPGQPHPGGLDFVVAKMSTNGGPPAVRVMGGNDADVAYGIAVGAESVFAVGFSRSTTLGGVKMKGPADGVLVKYD